MDITNGTMQYEESLIAYALHHKSMKKKTQLSYSIRLVRS